MKKWNAPVINELDLSFTAGGKSQPLHADGQIYDIVTDRNYWTFSGPGPKAEEEVIIVHPTNP